MKNKINKNTAGEKQNMIFKTKLWDNWARENASLSAGLVDGAIIALSMPQEEGKMVLLEKENKDFKVSIKNLEELERSGADLVFIMDKKSMEEILNDTSLSKFIELLSSGKIRVYAIKKQFQLIDKGYIAFLSRFGIRLGGSCCR